MNQGYGGGTVVPIQEQNGQGQQGFNQNQNGLQQAAGPTVPNPQPLKEVNQAMFCRLGQETVQEIMTRAQDLFQTLRNAQPPDGKFSPTGADRKPRFQDLLRHIQQNFKKLSVIYEQIERAFPSDRVVNFEAEILQKSEGDMVSSGDDKRNTEAYKLAVEEYREIMEQVMLRNQHLKQTIDHLRQIIWDVNTMLSARKE